LEYACRERWYTSKSPSSGLTKEIEDQRQAERMKKLAIGFDLQENRDKRELYRKLYEELKEENSALFSEENVFQKIDYPRDQISEENT